MNLTTKKSGSLVFYNRSASITLPKNALIQSASFDLEGLSTWGPGGPVKNFNYTHTNVTRAWYGTFAGPGMPTLASMQTNAFGNTDITAISKFDTSNATHNMANSGTGDHLFEFVLDPGLPF